MLIEVMVGALILAITTTAVLNGLDGAQKTGGRNKARSVAATLAEQDQERMRGMPVTSVNGTPDLIDYIADPYDRTVTVRGAEYRIISSASWATDNISASCTSSAKTSANLRIVSAVTSGLSRGTVDQASLVTPPPGSYGPNQGTVAVQVNDRAGAPITNATVNLSGTGSHSATTNSAGCAVFPFIQVGTYAAAVTFPTLVNWAGTTPPTGNTSANQGTVTLLALEVDRPTAFAVRFSTLVNNVAPAAANVPRSQWAVVANANLPSPNTKTFEASPAGAANTVVNATGLFPFTNGFNVYAGRGPDQGTSACPTNNPTTSPNTGTMGTLSVVPAGTTTTQSVTVRVPSINVRVLTTTTPTANPPGFNGATVVIRNADTGCANTFVNQTSSNVTYGSTTYVGALPLPGYPYGNYRLCAQRTTGSPAVTTHGHADVRSGGNYGSGHVNDLIPNTNPAGNPVAYGTNGAIRILVNQTGACH